MQLTDERAAQFIANSRTDNPLTADQAGKLIAQCKELMDIVRVFPEAARGDLREAIDELGELLPKQPRRGRVTGVNLYAAPAGATERWIYARILYVPEDKDRRSVGLQEYIRVDAPNHWSPAEFGEGDNDVWLALQAAYRARCPGATLSGRSIGSMAAELMIDGGLKFDLPPEAHE